MNPKALLTLAFAAAVFLTPATSTAVPGQPNILLIISDDHAWDDYSFMGHPIIETPRLDQLASESLLFPRGYVPASLCSPSLASIVTGLYPHQHKIVFNDPPYDDRMSRRDFYQTETYREGRERTAQFIEAVPTLPRELAKAGYLSHQSGKWWLKHYSRGGFTHGMTHGDEDRGGRHGDEGLTIGREGLEPIYNFIDMAESEKKPWFVYYAPFLPHTPHNPPERLLNKYLKPVDSPRIANYMAMVEWFDETCGDLLDHLDEKQLAGNTIVAYVVDNGWITDPRNGRYAPRSKQSQYDGGLRTPIMLRWPGHVTPRHDHTPVSSIDLMPTLLMAAGLTPPESLPGINLLDRNAVSQRPAIFGDIYLHDGVDLDNPAAGLRWRWMIQNDWKLIVPTEWNEPEEVVELYQIANDPYEQRNLANARPELVKDLKEDLDAWWAGEK